MILTLASLSACAHVDAASAKNDDQRPVVVFIPGYYGSALKEVGSDRRVFLTVRQLLFKSEALSLFQSELDTPPGPPLEVDGVLDSIRIFGNPISYDVYGDLQKNLGKWTNTRDARVIPFAYDWRTDLPRAASELATLVKSLKVKGAPRVDLVAHSMGALLAAYYLGYGGNDFEKTTFNWEGAKEIEKAVLLAPPFRGVFSIFRNMQRGAPPLLGNGSLLPSETVASFPSSYQLLPLPNARALTFDGKPVDLPVGDPKFWRERNLGLLARASGSETVRSKRVEFTEREVLRAAKFAERVQFNSAPGPCPTKILQVVGTGHPTIDTAYFDPKTGEFIFDRDKPKKRGLDEGALSADGDGTVSATSAKLPAAFESNATVHFSKEGHAGMFADKNIEKALEEFLK
jgi:pimeloyl-ACP methyl ester carboxylesterase